MHKDRKLKSLYGGWKRRINIKTGSSHQRGTGTYSKINMTLNFNISRFKTNCSRERLFEDLRTFGDT
jgi:hypothetical protein